MKAVTRTVRRVRGGSTVLLLGAFMIGTTVVGAAASTASDGEFSCTYKFQQNAGKVTGSCEGGTEFGSATGTFTGHMRPGGIGSGEFVLDLPSGKYSGSFKGKPFFGGKAKGTWVVKVGTLNLSGAFVALSG